MRRGNGERSEGFGGDGSGGSGIAAAKTSELGHDNEIPAGVLEAAWREATQQPRLWWDLGATWGPAEPLQWATVVGLVDSARELELIQSHMAQKPVLRREVGCACVGSVREENTARAVVDIYLNRGRYPIWACTLSIPSGRSGGGGDGDGGGHGTVAGLPSLGGERRRWRLRHERSGCEPRRRWWHDGRRGGPSVLVYRVN